MPVLSMICEEMSKFVNPTFDASFFDFGFVVHGFTSGIRDEVSHQNPWDPIFGAGYFCVVVSAEAKLDIISLPAVESLSSLTE